ncbi:MAG TPA: sigma-70 family RNA polymerase sigma factor [Solirubrobacteraceae bacterium]|nr:sigma-70 family RNA polymerase sigma factor [Solirubrobacteraceae bacterium]
MASLLQRSGFDDAELARRIAAGDGSAFATLDERHRRALTRYARSLLRRSEHDAEDVVQDVLIRAHDALRAGDGPDELRPWLYRLTRNRAIDEVRRARWGDEALDEAASLGDDRGDPDAVLSRRETMRRLVDDLADLPVRQRTALLARELDDMTPEQVAAQLGTSVPAAQMLATRARENLLKTRAARDADHADIREALLDAHERGVRPSEHVLRHVRACDACRAYGRELRRLSKQLQALNPGLVALPIIGAIAKVLGGGGGKVVVAGAAALALAATGGVLVLADDRFEAGERRSVTVTCPSAMKVAGMQAPEQTLPLSYGLSKGTIIGFSRKARIDFGRARLDRSYDVTVGVLCRRPDANGSIASNPRLPQRGEQPGRICLDSEILYRAPGKLFVGTVFRSQPVSIQRRSASGNWVRVVPDVGSGGWVKAGALCR